MSDVRIPPAPLGEFFDCLLTGTAAPDALLARKLLSRLRWLPDTRSLHKTAAWSVALSLLAGGSDASQAFRFAGIRSFVEWCQSGHGADRRRRRERGLELWDRFSGPECCGPDPHERRTRYRDRRAGPGVRQRSDRYRHPAQHVVRFCGRRANFPGDGAANTVAADH